MIKTARFALLVLVALMVDGHGHTAVAATGCLSITGTTATPVNLGTTLTFNATCCGGAVPAFSGLHLMLLSALLLLLGGLAFRRSTRVVSGLGLLGMLVFASRPAEGDVCGGPFSWTAQSAGELFSGTGPSFSFRPTLPGTFAVTVQSSTETATLSPPIAVSPSLTQAVTIHHKNPSRNGIYIQPTMTKAVAAAMHLDTTFHATIVGNVYAQPLYVPNGPGGTGMFIIVTESNNVHAVAEADGSAIWTRNVGVPATKSGVTCGNIAPIGITGTPAIDLASRTMYFSAAIGNATNILRHEIHALSIDDGSERMGYPLDTTSLTFGGTAFTPVVQNQRGAALIANGTLYIPYGAHDGDCGAYRGWVVGVPLANPGGMAGWAGAAKAGVWAVTGLSGDGTDVFVPTGNTGTFLQLAPPTTPWTQGEAILRFHSGLPAFTNSTTDYFTPSNWRSLDQLDLDFGGSGPLIVDVAGATPSQLVVVLGKNGVAYLLNRANLGGVGHGNGTTGEGLASLKVVNGPIINPGVTYTTAQGTYVAFSTGAMALGCPAGQGGNFVALKIVPASPPTLQVAWCQTVQGRGTPIVTTTDGTSQTVVWVLGDIDHKFRGFDGDTNAAVFAGGGASDLATGVHFFNSPIAVNGRIVFAAHNALLAYKSP